VPEIEWLKKAKIYFLTIKRMKVRDQGVGRVAFSEGLSPWLVDSHLLPVSTRGVPFMYLYLNFLSL
jgi:predicted YcjX-like family ATPase